MSSIRIALETNLNCHLSCTRTQCCGQRARRAKTVTYFIQTSETIYERKDKKKDNLYSDKVKEGRKICSKLCISKHYTQSMKAGSDMRYVYATVNLKNYQNFPCVLFLDLPREFNRTSRTCTHEPSGSHCMVLRLSNIYILDFRNNK